MEQALPFHFVLAARLGNGATHAALLSKESLPCGEVRIGATVPCRSCRVEMVMCYCPAAPAFPFHVAVLGAAIHVRELLLESHVDHCCQLRRITCMQVF
jgi:hypothetical protein